MKLTIMILAALLLTPPAALQAGERKPDRPNVVIILADDLGYQDLGCQGSKDIPTPNIDRLAQGGVRCTSGYVSWCACAPSRAGIITGRDSHRFGFYDNPTPVLARDRGLPPDIRTVPGALQERGYVTGGIGKWHLGTTPDRHPNRMGFVEWFGFLGGGHDYFPWEYYGRKIPKRPWPEWFVNGTLPILRNSEPVKIDRYMTDLLSDEAVAFVTRHREQPFFLYLAYNAPHSAYEAPKDEVAKLPLDTMAKLEAIPPELRRTYAAMVTRMDAGVGRILDALREQHLEENTIVFFLSDNGGGANSNDGGKPGYPSSNAPLRGFKGMLLEGGIRVPFIVSWKGTLPAGVTYDQPVSSFDMGATALALAGGAPSGLPLDGVNIIPYLTGKASGTPHERLYWKNYGKGAIREGRYKLITHEKWPQRELYDLDADIAESKNLAAEQPDLVKRLDAEWQKWNAGMPPPAWKDPPPGGRDNPEYQPPPWPEENAAATNGVHASQAHNPIIHADVPDVAVIRVGDTYYMSSTTMHMSPGLPIMKSVDLVNWQMVGYAYDTLGDDDALSLRNGKSAYGNGSWASSLRHHDGTFYVSTFSGTTGRTYVYATKDIEKGPWTVSSFKPALHDHSLFFDDDGRVYMVYGAGSIRIIELTADASAIKSGEVDQVIIADASAVAGPSIGLNAEGSQLRKIDGKYYLLNIVWPKGGMRTTIVHRADRISGPYEGRIALQDKGVAQGCLIDTPKGDWYACLFQDHGAVGRTPYLVPVRWEDGWPVLGVAGKVPDTLNLPAGTGCIPGIAASDEFKRRPGERALPLVWQWNHNPDDQFWSLTQRPGFLRLTAGRVDADFLAARNTLTQRTFGPECSATTVLDVTNMKAGDFAGLALLQKKYGMVGVKHDGKTGSIVMVSAESGSAVEVQRIPLARTSVFLRADCDFKDRRDTAQFYYSLDGTLWTAIGEPLKMAYTLPHFMGYRFGLFALATQTPGGYADFDYFHVSPQISAARRKGIP